MIYIVVALKSEAQAFVDYFKLKKSKLHHFTLFENVNICLIISQIGVSNARLATQALIDAYDITQEDIFYNIGICGASSEFGIGEILEIGTIHYKEKKETFYQNKEIIHCVDEAMNSQEFEIVDMESYGFYDAIVHNPAITKFHIYKIVSDNFEPHLVTKEGTKSLLFAKMKELEKIMHL